MPIMAPRTQSDRPWSTLFPTNTKTPIATKIGAINRGISTKIDSPSLISLRPPRPTPPKHDGRTVRPRLWRWYYPPGHPPVFPSTLHHDPHDPPAPSDLPQLQPSRPKTTTPRHRHRALGSAHRRSIRRCIRRQRQQHQRALATPLHFAPRQRKHSTRWLLIQAKFFPPDTSAASDDVHHNDDESRSPTTREQIDISPLATAPNLDAAPHDPTHDRSQLHSLRNQHNNTDQDIDLPINHSDEHPDDDPLPPHAPPNPHADQNTTPKRRITRSMTAAANRGMRTIARISDTDNPPPGATT